ncbi:MAG: DNA primase noncatalytic subunit PriX [Desulfurococcaceae archaeon]
MNRLNMFLSFLREYFRGPMGDVEYREMFICRGDPATARVKDRGAVWIHGLETYLSTYIKSLKELKNWNIYIGVGFVIDPGLTNPVLEKMLYDRVSFDFDSEENPDTAVSRSLEFGRYLNDRYGVTPIVFKTGFKGAHVVIPLSKPVDWEIYQLLWKKLYSEIPAEARRLVDMNMLQWNRVDRVPLTYNVKESGSRFCRIIYPKKFSWEDFSWSELKPLDPAIVRLIKVIVPQVVKPKIIASGTGKSWIWKVVDRGLPDGRRRFMLYVLIPHLINVMKDEKSVIEICRKFVENSCRNHGKCKKIYESWIRSTIDSSIRLHFKGFSLNTLREKDPELYKLINEVIYTNQ